MSEKDERKTFWKANECNRFLQLKTTSTLIAPTVHMSTRCARCKHGDKVQNYAAIEPSDWHCSSCGRVAQHESSLQRALVPNLVDCTPKVKRSWYWTAIAHDPKPLPATSQPTSPRICSCSLPIHSRLPRQVPKGFIHQNYFNLCTVFVTTTIFDVFCL